MNFSKHLSLLALFLFFPLLALAEGGISFYDGDLDGAIAKARAEGKLVFVDAFTTWCGPCKMMEANTFTDPDVAAYAEEHFVSIQIDMEGPQGERVYNDYGVGAYPTLLFLDGQGDLVHRSCGYLDGEGFLAVAQEANDENARFAALYNRYVDDLDTHREDLMALLEDNCLGEQAQDFLPEVDLSDILTNRATLEEALSQAEMDALTPGSLAELKAMEAQLVDTYGPEVNPLMRAVYTGQLIELTQGEFVQADYEVARDGLAKYMDDEDPEMVANYIDQNVYAGLGMEEQFMEAIRHYATTYATTSTDFDNVAWKVYESCYETENLEQGLEWVNKSIALEKNFSNLETKAALLHDLERAEEAKATIAQAKELAGPEDDLGFIEQLEAEL